MKALVRPPFVCLYRGIRALSLSLDRISVPLQRHTFSDGPDFSPYARRDDLLQVQAG